MDGVTLRDYFATMALNGLLSSGGGEGFTDEVIAKASYKLADHMMIARKIPCRLCGKPLADGEAWRKVHGSCADSENAEADRPELRLVDLGGEG